MSVHSRISTILLCAALALTLLLGGCATMKYKQLDVQISPAESPDAMQTFFRTLMLHLATMREYAFAGLYLQGEYVPVDIRRTGDGRRMAFVLEAVPGSSERHISPLSRYAYVYFAFDDSPYLVMQKNTFPLAEYTDDGDGLFKGTYKLTIMNARYCSGESRSSPVVADDDIHFVPFQKTLRKSLYSQQKGSYTPPYCQGLEKNNRIPEQAGVRFYFEDQQSLERFASELLAAFPFIEVH